MGASDRMTTPLMLGSAGQGGAGWVGRVCTSLCTFGGVWQRPAGDQQHCWVACKSSSSCMPAPLTDQVALPGHVPPPHRLGEGLRQPEAGRVCMMGQVYGGQVVVVVQ